MAQVNSSRPSGASIATTEAFGGRFRIFKGIESDILPDGSLDYPDDVLRRFDREALLAWLEGTGLA